MSIAGIDFSTFAVDVVLLDENTDAATWHRFELSGQDAFDRARSVREAMIAASPLWDDVQAIGIEDPRGYGAGSLYRVQGAILARLPHRTLVQPWIPSEWRKEVGLPGNASKLDVWEFVVDRAPNHQEIHDKWSYDSTDAYCIALATQQRLQYGAAA